jgi:hypothetical protein
MSAFRTLAAAALLSSAAFLPSQAGAFTPAGVAATPNVSLVEPGARVCRVVCRNGYFRESCRWVPERRERVERFERRERFEDRRERRPAVEFRVGPGSDY